MKSHDNLIDETPACTVVSDFLSRNGVPEDQWGSTLANVIGGHYQTAKRRLASQETFSLAELQQIASTFRTTVSAMLQATYPQERVVPGAHQASLQLGSGSVDCQVVTRPTNQAPRGGLVAFEKEGEWHVRHATDAPTGQQLHVVLGLHVEAQDSLAPIVAIVDDEAPDTLVRYLNRSDFQATHYTDADSVMQLLTSPRRPEAYILDWTLGNGQTSRHLIEAIRRVDSTCPIILLTGTIQSVRTNESEIARVIAQHDVELCEKPARFPILVAKLRVRLERQLRLPD